MPKALARTELLKRRISLASDDVRRLGGLIQQHVLSLPEFHAAKVVGLYHPVKNEVETSALFAAARAEGKTVALPRTVGDALEFVAIARLEELVVGRYGIGEPLAGEVVSISEFDLLVVPGVGFDRRGHRLGYGKGFYDRTLADRRSDTVLIGLGYECQIVPLLPVQSHDIALDLLVTESSIYRY